MNVATARTKVLNPLQDQKVRLYGWDGKSLSEIATLEGNKGAISALAFSPDGSQLAAGDVRPPGRNPL